MVLTKCSVCGADGENPVCDRCHGIGEVKNAAWEALVDSYEEEMTDGYE